jgi:hypothetical protein
MSNPQVPAIFDNIVRSATTTTTTNKPSENQSLMNASLVLDVATIGSNTRLDYMKAQQETWASSHYVRHVFTTTEDDDAMPNCTMSTFPTEQSIKWHVNACRKRHKLDRRFKHMFHYVHARWVLNKAHPAGWLCAQHRPGTALYKALQSYSNNNTTTAAAAAALPDYLLLVDDDTYYDIPRLTPLLQASKQEATVYVGCLTIVKSIFRPNLYRVSPFGGGGVILSKQTLQRLLQPMHCPTPSADDSAATAATADSNNSRTDEWCRQLDRNLLGEHDVFRNGMTMGELIYQFYNRRPNCFISDWPLAYFIHYYHLADVPWQWPAYSTFPDPQQHQEQPIANQTVTAMMPPVRILPITRVSVKLYYNDPQWQQGQQQLASDAGITNLCPLLQDPRTEYPPGTLVGHYLSPHRMHQLYQQSKIQ